MRRFSLLLGLLAGCVHGPAVVSVDRAVLGRVVIYRNGVAFYERRATVVDGKLAVHVPRARVDDFLKSLTVVDPATRKPLSVSIPRQEYGDRLQMTIETGDRRNADVLLTYVTEAPAWKPSYRVVVGPNGKVMLEGWAIVDNLSGEDWKDVQVGVGASSALAFRYDLWSVRHVDRDLLQGDERFAIAPPTGVSPYEFSGAELLGELKGAQGDASGVSFSGASSQENQFYVDGVNTTGLARSGSSPAGSHDTGSLQGVVTDKRTGQKLAGVSVVASGPGTATAAAITDDNGFYRLSSLPKGTYVVTFFYADIQIKQAGVSVSNDKVTPVSQQIDQEQTAGEVVQTTGKAPTIDPTSSTQGITIDKNYLRNIPVPGRTFEAALGAVAGSTSDAGGSAVDLRGIAAKVTQSHKDVVIEVHDRDAKQAELRAGRTRDRLVDEGVPLARIRVVPKVGPGEGMTLRLLAVAPGSAPEPSAPPPARAQGPDTPVGESHFLSERPLTVRTGTSTMVAMVHAETSGGVVYLYDPISDRGDQRFAFKAVRLDNPASDTLEPGPITVYGDGRFIGEGITEPVPPHAAVVVPFALDRQIVVSTKESERDQIARLVTVQRGIVTAEVQHRLETHFTLTSRLDRPARVYLRHRLKGDWTVVAAPPRSLQLGDSRLFEVDLAPGATQEVTIAEATPVQRTLELSSPETLDLMHVFVEDPQASPELRAQIDALVGTQRAAADLTDRIQTLRDQLSEYRTREGELHAQVVTLRAVRAGGDLVTALKAKLSDTNDRIQKATLAIVEAQERLMLLRVKFQNQLADLHLS
jgi:hypothetical protein